MLPRTLLKSIKFLIFTTVIGTPLFYFKWSVYPYTLTKQLFFQSVIELLFVLWLALAVQDKKYRPRWTPFTIGLTVFLLFLTFAALFGVDPVRSFWSTYERAIGVVAVYHLSALALVLSSLGRELPWRKIFYASLGTSFVLSVIAWMQLYNDSLLLLSESAGGRPGSTFGNPSFLADYLLFNIFIGTYLIFDYWRAKEDRGILSEAGKPAFGGTRPSPYELVFLFVVLAANLSALFIAQTRGAIIGLGVGAFILLLFFAVRPPKLSVRTLSSRAFYAGIAAAIVLFGGIFWFTRGSAVWSKVPGLSRFKDISSILTTDEFIPRRAALAAAWQGFLEKPILGWGSENFNIVFNAHYDPKTLESSYGETRFDKPHNFVMESLVSGGILLALAYFTLFGLFVFESVRLRDRLWAGIAIAAIIAYATSDFFLFETIGGLPMLYLLFGFVDGIYRSEKAMQVRPENKKQHQASPRAQSDLLRVYAPWGFLAIGCIGVYFVNILSFKASYNQWLGFDAILHGQQKAAMDDFRAAASTASPYKWNFERDFAAEAAQIYFYNPGFLSNQDVLDGVAAMEAARDAHPLDAYNHYALIDIYNQVSALDVKKYTSEAEHEAQVALELSPNRQEILFSLAKTKSIEGDNHAALGVLKQALDLDPKVPESHFYYGLLAFATGDSNLGYQEVEASIQMGRKWKTYYEPRTVANFFADSGHLAEAIGLYKDALVMEPEDAETEIKLGMAYYAEGDMGNARQYLSDAAKKFDFTKSPSYGEFKPILDRLGIE